MKGNVATEKVVYSIFGLLLLAVVLAVIFVNIDPLKSAEFKGLELASGIPAYINGLSSLNDIEGFVEIQKGVEFDLSVEFDEDEGYFVVVNPYRDDKKLESFRGHILSYPMERSEDLEVSLVQITKVCVEKDALEKLAKVVVC